ncbi:MAG TPA: hypothetical protein VEC19_19095 [Usitatibacter sp.]|nr:hypothetical protein [Usitatibacter sp.]
MRTAALVFFLLPAVAVAAPPVVDLDRPGVLEAIERDNPELHRRIAILLDQAQAPTCEHLPQVLKAQLGVEEYRCRSALFLTSHPAKRRVFFTLEGMGYASNVVQERLAEPRLRKAQDR